jgi:hypothetical protein
MGHVLSKRLPEKGTHKKYTCTQFSFISPTQSEPNQLLFYHSKRQTEQIGRWKRVLAQAWFCVLRARGIESSNKMLMSHLHTSKQFTFITFGFSNF